MSINVLGVFAPLPLGEGGKTNRVWDASGVATAVRGAGGVSFEGKGTSKAGGGRNDFRREDLGGLEDDALESTESCDDDTTDEEDATELADEKVEDRRESDEGEGATWI